MDGSGEMAISRRGILVGGAATAALTTMAVSEAPAHTARSQPQPAMMKVSMTVNGERQSLTLDTRTTLLDALREHLRLTGTKKGCDHGQCGACTVLVNGTRINSLPQPRGDARGRQDHHDRGAGHARPPAPDAGGLHRSTTAINAAIARPARSVRRWRCWTRSRRGVPSHVQADLTAAPQSTNVELRERMSGNICRCGAYSNIAEAMTEVAGGSTRMRAFTYERAHTAPRRRPRPRREPGAKFIAGGTNLLDLMKLEIETPTHLVDVQDLSSTGSSRRRTAACGSARWSATPRSPPTPRAARLWRADARDRRRRLGPAAQQGDHGRQPAPAHALPVFLRHQPAVQQAPARLGLRGDRRLFAAAGVIGTSDACIATYPGDMAVAMRVLDATVETVDAAGQTRAIPIAGFHRLGATRRRSRPLCRRASSSPR